MARYYLDTCPLCDVEVTDMDKHIAWHNKNDGVNTIIESTDSGGHESSGGYQYVRWGHNYAVYDGDEYIGTSDRVGGSVKRL
jgi:hypothetical protein